jgi:hypothetical protein
MQLDLFGSRKFSPINGGTSHYVPVLQNKAGELTALAEAPVETWQHMTPVVQVVGPKKLSPSGISLESIGSWAKKISAAVGDRPCFLDVVRLNPAALTSPGKPGSKPRSSLRGTRRPAVLGHLYECMRRRRVLFVPVLPIGQSSAAHVRIIRDSVIQDGRGVALRFPVLGTVPFGGPEALLHGVLDKLEEKAENSDLILDFSWISPDTEIHVESTAVLINKMISMAKWRNLIFVGTSIPSSLRCVPEDSLGYISREEWALWKTLQDTLPNSRLVFGDYGIQHPKPPQDSGPGMRANIRYTTEDRTLVARGKGAVFIEGKEQYRKLCRQIVSRPEYLGESYSWGDAQIQLCADGEIDPASQILWRAAGTSHHMGFVAQQLANHSQPKTSA